MSHARGFKKNPKIAEVLFAAIPTKKYIGNFQILPEAASHDTDDPAERLRVELEG